MIVDSLKNAALYYGVCPRMQRAFELLAELDLETIEDGKHLLDGEDIFINVMSRDLKTTADAKFEVHNVYADIQILIHGEKEGFGWKERCDLEKPQGDFSDEKDVQLFDDDAQFIYYIKPSEFTILMPEDGHAPMIGEGKVKKAIVKVKI